MNKDILVLKDGTEIELETGASISAVQVAMPDRAAMLETWNKFTEENLKQVQVKTGGGLTVGNYQELILVSECSVVAADGSVLTTYQFREKTVEEKRLDALEEGQAVHAGVFGLRLACLYQPQRGAGLSGKDAAGAARPAHAV